MIAESSPHAAAAQRDPRDAGQAEREAIEHLRSTAARLVPALEKVSARLGSSRTAASSTLVARTERFLADPGHRLGAESIEQRILQRTTFGWNVALQEQIDGLGWREFLDWQLEPDSIDDGGLEDALLEALPSLSERPLRRLAKYQDLREVPTIELAFAKLIRALLSPRQLLERTVELWNDHLHTAIEADLGPFLKADYDRDLRAQSMTSFRLLLGASAHGPAMLDYLTNNTNFRGHPNENYARELMELHTLGVDGGFTQEDVREVARAFTGWTFYDPRNPENAFGRFLFLHEAHDFEAKTVLGTQLPAGQGVADGEAVLDLLAAHESTARFVARKMLVQFVGYTPKERDIDRVARVYQDSGGDLRSLLRAVLSWHGLTAARPKFKRPFHLVTSSLRALFAGLDGAAEHLLWLFSAGHFPFYWSPPNGYPDAEGYWALAPLGRWNFGNATLAGSPDIDGIVELLSGAENAVQVVALLDQLLVGGLFSDATRNALLEFLDGRTLDAIALREAIGLAVSSPEFQNY